MAFKAFLSNPAQEIRHRRHSSIVDRVPKTSDGTTPAIYPHDNSIKRLSLGLSRTNEDTFPPFLTHEPEQMHAQPGSSHGSHTPERSITQNAVSAPSLASESTEVPQLDTATEEVDDILPLPKAQRFSLLGFRHASDPQLSTRFRKQEPQVANNALRK